MKKLFLFFFILIICSNSIYAVPELPMIISGDVAINERPAKIGTEITAKLNDNEINKVKVAEKGKFTLLLQKLNENDQVKLYVDSIDTQQIIKYKSGDYKELSLNVKKSYSIYYITGALILLIIIIIFIRKKRR